MKKLKVVTRSEWYLPDYDEHFSEKLDNGMYQAKQRRFALRSVKKYNIALDIGSNIGFWSKPLCDQFQKVVADQRASQKLLTAALEILKGVYEKAALVQTGQAPPPGFKEYKKNENIGGAMGMV